MQEQEFIGIAAVVLIVVFLLVLGAARDLALRAARDPRLARFRFSCHASLRGIGIEVESQRTPGDESAELP